jgi:hypothetical protein
VHTGSAVGDAMIDHSLPTAINLPPGENESRTSPYEQPRHLSWPFLCVHPRVSSIEQLARRRPSQSNPELYLCMHSKSSPNCLENSLKPLESRLRRSEQLKGGSDKVLGAISSSLMRRNGYSRLAIPTQLARRL